MYIGNGSDYETMMQEKFGKDLTPHRVKYRTLSVRCKKRIEAKRRRVSDIVVEILTCPCAVQMSVAKNAPSE